MNKFYMNGIKTGFYVDELTYKLLKEKDEQILELTDDRDTWERRYKELTESIEKHNKRYNW
jgi:hypothetical protein